MTEKGIHDDVLGFFFFPRRIRYYLDDLKKKKEKKNELGMAGHSIHCGMSSMPTEEEKSPDDDDGTQKKQKGKIANCLEITIIFFTHLREQKDLSVYANIVSLLPKQAE